MNPSTESDFLSAMLGTEGFGELRGPALGRDGRIASEFFDLSAERAHEDMAARATEAAELGDVWVGHAPRTCQRGDLDAVEFSRCLIVDADSRESAAAVGGFHLKPSWIVLTGSVTDGYAHRQVGWLLDRPVPRERFAELENRLVNHLHGDPKWNRTGAGVIRVPGTLNWKTDPPRSVELGSFHV